MYYILSEKMVRIVVSPAKKCLGSIYDAEREKLEALGRDLGVSVDAVVANYIMTENARVGRDVVVLTSEVVEAKSIAKKYLDFVRVPSECLRLLCKDSRIEEKWVKYSCNLYLPPWINSCFDLPGELRKFALLGNN